jgi:AcrR family transcriptional regulator
MSYDDHVSAQDSAPRKEQTGTSSKHAAAPSSPQATGAYSGRTRRRGAQLQAALLQAGWDEITAVGYANFTMESVADRARTGVAVLYRRWANKDELALAVFKHYRDTHPVTAPNTGSLREDLLELLKGMGQQPASFFNVAFGAAFSGLLASADLTIDQFREKILNQNRTDQLNGVYQRAHERGEIDLSRVPKMVLRLPTDLIRHDMLMYQAPISKERITFVIDDVVLPLLFASRSNREEK